MTKIYDAFDGLLTLIQNAVPASVRVFDGQQPQQPTDKEYIVVGCDDVTSTGFTLGVDTGVQNWLDLGAYSKEETFVIHCAHVTWSGATGFAALRSQAKTTLGLIDTAIRNPTSGIQLGTALGPTGWSSMAVLRVQPILTDLGATLITPFIVACTARI